MKNEGSKYSHVSEYHAKTPACVGPGAFPGVHPV